MRNAPLTREQRNLRTRARRRALQAVYAWQLSGNPMREIEQQFAHEQDAEQADLAYFHALIFGVETAQQELDALLQPLLDRDIEQVDPIERAVLRLASWELSRRPDTPGRVVLNEALELAKRFGANQGHTYVNGILDPLARQLRASELGAPG